MTPHDVANEVKALIDSDPGLNEADTRHQIIDRTLHEVLSWPRVQTKCEQFIGPGYADYVLVNRRDSDILFVEAKREGTYFTLPTTFASESHSRFVKVSTLLTDKATRDAIVQVQQYCLSQGCEYAAVTNGREWIFFKTFQPKKPWKDLQAFVIERYDYFTECFSEATQRLSYTAIEEQASLRDLFGDPTHDNRPVYYPKSSISSYDQEVYRNHLAKSIRPIIQRYFSRMDPHDDAFMEACYVRRREYRESESNVNNVIHDTLSPYFRDFSVKTLFAEKESGEFFERIPSGQRDKRSRDVIVLFGGKGYGKSTFASRILYHRPSEAIEHFSKPVVVDLLECPEDKRLILEETYKQLIEKLDSDSLLKSDRPVVLELFADRFTLAKKQALAGLDVSSPEYNVRLNDLIETWKADHAYVSARLASYWNHLRKGPIVVLDNTDQYSPDIQEYCFTIAQMIATGLDCLVIVNMREERFYVSKIAGTLDAFHNSGCLLYTSPSPRDS